MGRTLCVSPTTTKNNHSILVSVEDATSLALDKRTWSIASYQSQVDSEVRETTSVTLRGEEMITLFKYKKRTNVGVNDCPLTSRGGEEGMP